MGFFRRWLQNDVKKMIEEAEERERAMEIVSGN